jgi:hypothetical protein
MERYSLGAIYRRHEKRYHFGVTIIITMSTTKLPFDITYILQVSHIIFAATVTMIRTISLCHDRPVQQRKLSYDRYARVRECASEAKCCNAATRRMMTSPPTLSHYPQSKRASRHVGARILGEGTQQLADLKVNVTQLPTACTRTSTSLRTTVTASVA